VCETLCEIIGARSSVTWATY